MMLGISQPTIALLKRHKRAACMRTLLSYAFSHTEAAAAAAAAGCDAPVAARLLFAGQPCAGFQPVEITR